MRRFCLWSGILSLALTVLANVLPFKSSSPYSVVFAESTKSLTFSPDISETFTTRISVSSNGVQANASSYRPFVSADGRYVAFESWASNLMAGDNNETKDIFVHDRDTGQTTCVSVATDGTQASGESQYLSITADGRYVTFNSEASNLVTGDSNGTRDIFIHDRQSGETNCVSVASDGTLGNDRSRDADVSADGRYVAFDSRATNLTSGDTNATQDIFVHDRQTGQTTRVSIASDGTQANNRSYWPYLSADGQYVAFYSYANNLVEDDTNGYADVFVHNRQTGETTRVSVASDGTQANDHSCTDTEYRYGLDISADGRYVVFASRASNLVINDTNESWDIFVRDLWTHQTTRVSVTSAGTQGNADSTYPSISTDGQYIAFTSNANNLAIDDTNGVSDIFVHNRETGETRRISVASDGTQGNALSQMPSISGNGHYVVFSSDASNIVDDDTNGGRDIFVHKQDITYQAYLPLILTTQVIPSRLAHLTYNFNFQNSGPGTITRLDVYVAVPSNRDSQQISNLSFSTSYTPLTDRYGQDIAYFQFTNLSAGQKASISWEGDIEVFRKDYNLDPDLVESIDQIPPDIVTLYTTNENMYRLDSQVIQDAAQVAANGATNPYWIARNIHDFVANRLSYLNDHRWDDAETVYIQQHGSCTEYTYLFIALCRVNGLPARYVGGTIRRGEGTSVDTSFHRWAEVYLPPYGWVPIDVQADDRSSGISYANFGIIADNRFATTIGGGNSEYLSWNYHDRYQYYYSGSTNVTRERSFTWVSVPTTMQSKLDTSSDPMLLSWSDDVIEMEEGIPVDKREVIIPE
jgi:transglutaminase-like putative cysteine protease